MWLAKSLRPGTKEPRDRSREARLPADRPTIAMDLPPQSHGCDFLAFRPSSDSSRSKGIERLAPPNRLVDSSNPRARFLGELAKPGEGVPEAPRGLRKGPTRIGPESRSVASVRPPAERSATRSAPAKPKEENVLGRKSDGVLIPQGAAMPEPSSHGESVRFSGRRSVRARLGRAAASKGGDFLASPSHRGRYWFARRGAKEPPVHRLRNFSSAGRSTSFVLMQPASTPSDCCSSLRNRKS